MDGSDTSKAAPSPARKMEVEEDKRVKVLEELQKEYLKIKDWKRHSCMNSERKDTAKRKVDDREGCARQPSACEGRDVFTTLQRCIDKKKTIGQTWSRRRLWQRAPRAAQGRKLPPEPLPYENEFGTTEEEEDVALSE